MNITPKENNQKFNEFLFKEIDYNLYKYKFLNDYMSKVVHGLEPLYDLSVLNISEKGWILILHGKVLFVHGENSQDKQIKEISKVFDLNKFNNFLICGDNDLINKLINFYNPKNFQVEKSRLLYKTDDIILFNDNNVQFVNGSVDRLNELALMLQQYYHEEYNGLNNKTIEEMQRKMFSYIQKKTIYVLLNMDDKILCFCTINDPDIGIMFTNKEYRNMGYGKIILSYCSKLLNDKNTMVYVMTDYQKIESNIVCEAVGFKPYYHYTMIRINSSELKDELEEQIK